VCTNFALTRPYPKQKRREKTKAELLQKHGNIHVTKTDVHDLAERPKKALDKRKKDFKTVLYSKIHQNEQITGQASCRKCIPIYFFRCRNLQPVKEGLVCGGHIAQNKDEHS
jgi:hypothetical protein